MNAKDKAVLREMEHAVASFTAGTLALGHLVERLLVLRDTLAFKDPDWSRELTQQLVTLDSASVEPPAEATKANEVKAAVDAAILEISRLIRRRLDAEQAV